MRQGYRRPSVSGRALSEPGGLASHERFAERISPSSCTTCQEGQVTDPYIPVRRRPTDAELQAESRITEQDLLDAEAAFNRYTSEESRDLLRGDVDDDDA
jgi:hypothetical protein